jgi:hypothetical protein
MEIDEMSAYGISQAIKQAIDEGFIVDDETGEVFFKDDILGQLNEALDKKVNSICGYIKSLESSAEGLKKRKAEIDAVQKSKERKAESLKKYLNELMIMNGKESGMQVDDYKVSYRKSTKGEIYDPVALKKYIDADDKLAEKYYKVTYEFKNKELSDDVKAGAEIPGFKLVENKNIQIK